MYHLIFAAMLAATTAQAADPIEIMNQQTQMRWMQQQMDFNKMESDNRLRQLEQQRQLDQIQQLMTPLPPPTSVYSPYQPWVR